MRSIPGPERGGGVERGNKVLENSGDVFLNYFKEPRNRFQLINSASLCSIVGRQVRNTIPTRFLAPVDCSKIQALDVKIVEKIWSNKIDRKIGRAASF